MQSSELQVRFAVEAISRGGLLGVGVGNSEAKLGLLPLAWSDSIFAVIGEELGLLGCLLVVLLFAIFAYRGLRAALAAADNFGMLLATGITCIIVLQAILNLAVTVAAVPPTGVPLPFISYGGSSLATTLGAVGILLSISRYGRERVAQSARETSKATAKAGGSSKSTKSSAQSGGRSAVGEAAYARFDFRRGNGRSRLSGAGRRATSGRSGGRKASTSKRSAAKRKSAKPPAKSTQRSATGRASRAAKSKSTPSKRTVAKRR